MPLSGWRSSRAAAIAAQLPLVRDLPMAPLEATAQRLRRLRAAGAATWLALFAWLRTGRVWASRRDAPQPAWAHAIARAFGHDLLRVFFFPAALLRRPLLPRRIATEGIDASLAALARSSDASADLPPRRAIVYSSSQGNFFHAEMAELIARGLEASACFEVQRLDENAEPGEADLHLVAAPHEFFSLGAGARFAAPEHRAFRERCSLFLAEQPGTTHFLSCLPFAAEARRVLDLNASSAAVLRAMGFDARFFPVGPLPSSDAGEAPTLSRANASRHGMSLAGALAGGEERPLDLLFMGVLTRRRAEFFSRHAEFFASRRCLLSLPTSTIPLRRGVASTLDRDEATALCRRSKILLNVHRDESPYFEWHRVVIRGMWQQALVVSEPSELPPGFVAGTHLLEAPLAELPELLRWLLESEDGKRKAGEVRAAAQKLLTEHYDMRVWSRALAASLALE